MSDIFRFRLDADICKSEGEEGDRIIQGYASTETQDRQGESLLQKGLDISEFVNNGYLNYDHDNSIILGYPLPECRIDDNGFWVKGVLLKGVPIAERIWSLALALKKSNAPRKVGFSVEGKVLQRDPVDKRKILKAKIFNVAVTTNPVNTTCTWDAVVKSFNHTMNSDSEYQETYSKSLSAGYEVDPTQMSGGGVFRREDLDKELVNLSYVMSDEELKKILKQKMSTRKSLSFNQIALYLQVTRGWSYNEASDFIGKHIL